MLTIFKIIMPNKLKNIKSNLFVCLALLCLLVTSCTEPYALQTNSYEEAIVIEGTITNELKNQEIKVSRTFRFEENGPTAESGATVYITDNLGKQYDFEEKKGVYVSKIAFQAEPNKEYRLRVIAKDGESYTSRSETLTTVNAIESLSSNITTIDNEKGIQITANSFDPTGKSRYYRYEYEETYKIIAPKWVNIEAITTVFKNNKDEIGEIILQPRGAKEVRTCYSTKKSDKIILTNTNTISEDKVNYPIRFISSSNYIIMNRYSILVKQYIQNLAAYTYYQTLKELSGSESLLSQNQPGFFAGNIKSDNNPNRKVIGYFEVSSYSEKRMFFNFSDVFPKEQKPDYPYNCPGQLTEAQKKEYILQYCFYLPPISFTCKGLTVINKLSTKEFMYYDGYKNFGKIPFDGSINIEMYPIECGDCTSFSSNTKPPFWID
jgi:hypothetical protein